MTEPTAAPVSTHTLDAAAFGDLTTAQVDDRVAQGSAVDR
jgi:hypothetical protein